MPGLASLLGKLKEARAERLLYTADEVAYAFSGERRWPLGTEKVRAATLLAAVAEILSHDELSAIPTNRPRIVRHEHEGEQYVVEVTRDGGGVKLGVRLGKATIKRDSVREPPPLTAALTPAPPAPPAPPPSGPAPSSGPTPPATTPRRAEKRTLRVDVDDEGNPVDTTTVELERAQTVPQVAAVKVPKRETTKVKRPSTGALSRRPVHQTVVVPPLGMPAANNVISGDPGGAHVTFLFAPGGFALESVSGVVTASADGAAVCGELYVPPSMKLRILQGRKESIVSYYRFFD